MKSFGPLYVDSFNYPPEVGKRLPLFELGWSQEIEEPFRSGSCLVFRPPFTRKALALGVFLSRIEDEDEALIKATQARGNVDINIQLAAGKASLELIQDLRKRQSNVQP